MSSRTGTYGAALRATMRTTAAAYGYTLSTAASIGVLTQLAGKPDTARLVLFALGGVTAFVVLEALLAAVRPPAPQPPEQAFPFAGALNAASVGAALAMATLVAHLIRSPLAWFLTQLSTCWSSPPKSPSPPPSCGAPRMPGNQQRRTRQPANRATRAHSQAGHG